MSAALPILMKIKDANLLRKGATRVHEKIRAHYWVSIYNLLLHKVLNMISFMRNELDTFI